MNVFAIVAVIAIGVFVAVEVLVAYQKYQLKKHFLDELDGKDPS
ncbi:MAG: hypothetical protein ACYCPW_11210 [Nitrososphaerales archaeon]